MQVDLPPQLEEQIRRRIAAGRYRSASEVVEAALHQYFARPTEEEVMDRAFELIEEERQKGRYRNFHDFSAFAATVNEALESADDEHI
ncbi:MAG: type II toxin-antitoxin system ParD family antitoxin [Verrucomicrobiota bacterium JB022]|nr:type II toxin-antitoxin system ParD family antitoxin [Verrucomicrobiota bacterium JB022]